jgi:hypothetical protein
MTMTEDAESGLSTFPASLPEVWGLSHFQEPSFLQFFFNKQSGSTRKEDTAFQL